MTSLERRAVSGLAGIFALRMLGLFLLLPVLALYAAQLSGATPFMIGLALGAYGLTQAMFQIPLGMASDRWGRKPIIVAGLLVFALGSVVAALADSAWGVVLGRALQGAGAIAAAVIALLADLTRDEQRTKAMAIIGVTIGSSFMVALLAGPLLAAAVGLSGIFWLTAVLAVGGIVVLFTWVPSPQRAVSRTELPGSFGRVLRNPTLLRLDLGIFVLHLVLTAMFVVVPVGLVREAGLPPDEHWQVYVPVLILSVLVMLPFVLLAERRNLMRPLFAGAVLLLAVAQGIFYQGQHGLAGLVAGLFVFFVAFNFLEAALPSLVSRAAPAASKGMAIGVYSTTEFLGAFVGGAAGGLVQGRFGFSGVFIMSALVLALWFLAALSMQVPKRLRTMTLGVGRCDSGAARALAKKLAGISGVAEAVVHGDGGIAHLKVDDNLLDQEALQDCAVAAREANSGNPFASMG